MRFRPDTELPVLLGIIQFCNRLYRNALQPNNEISIDKQLILIQLIKNTTRLNLLIENFTPITKICINFNM